ncbi:uncharacterized protein [Mobula birostris]|uniref:uncharacterized protein n=1 Tax=Mobula birostris TaxID=1983395 RepID=UPI003B280234
MVPKSNSFGVVIWLLVSSITFYKSTLVLAKGEIKKDATGAQAPIAKDVLHSTGNTTIDKSNQFIRKTTNGNNQIAVQQNGNRVVNSNQSNKTTAGAAGEGGQPSGLAAGNSTQPSGPAAGEGDRSSGPAASNSTQPSRPAAGEGDQPSGTAASNSTQPSGLAAGEGDQPSGTAAGNSTQPSGLAAGEGDQPSGTAAGNSTQPSGLAAGEGDQPSGTAAGNSTQPSGLAAGEGGQPSRPAADNNIVHNATQQSGSKVVSISDVLPQTSQSTTINKAYKKPVATDEVVAQTTALDIHTTTEVSFKSDINIAAKPAVEDGHFMMYLILGLLLLSVVYIAYHNKNKIISLCQKGGPKRTRRPKTSDYQRLDQNLSEVITSLKKKSNFKMS